MTEETRALTLTQPWAWAVAAGVKRWETRSWRTSYRGRMLIHAAASMPRAARLFAEEERAIGKAPERLALGAIVAVADLVDVRETWEVVAAVGALERRYGDYSSGRWAWRLANVRALETPLPARGALGLWRPSPDVLAAIKDAIT